MTYNNDYWGDYYNYKRGHMEGALHYYFLDANQLAKYSTIGNVAIPPVEAVVNVAYTPYITREDLQLREVQLDTERFPFYGKDFTVPNYYLRIQTGLGSQNFIKELGSIKAYKVNRKGGNKFHWSNEGKLWQYPFCYMALTDGLDKEIKLYSHLFNNQTGVTKVMVNTPINNMGIYSLYLNEYSGFNVYHRHMTTNVMDNAKNIPITSNPYTTFMANNQNQISIQKKQAITEGAIGATSGIVSGVIGGITAFATAGTVGIQDVAGGIEKTVTSGVNAYYAVKGAIAQERDMSNASNTLADFGTDVIFNKWNGNGSLTLYRLRQPDYIMDKIGTFFHMYGYAQNKLMEVNVRNRYYYNYIKTTEANLKSNGIPRSDLEEIINIYNQGVTIWHVDREGVTVGDYSMDNREV